MSLLELSHQDGTHARPCHPKTYLYDGISHENSAGPIKNTSLCCKSSYVSVSLQIMNALPETAFIYLAVVLFIDMVAHLQLMCQVYVTNIKLDLK